MGWLQSRDLGTNPLTELIRLSPQKSMLTIALFSPRKLLVTLYIEKTVRKGSLAAHFFNPTPESSASLANFCLFK